MGWMKKILIGLGVVAVTVVVGVYLLQANLGRIIKAALESAGPKITQTTLTVGDVKLSPSSGSGSIRDFVLGNPEGYKAPYALKVDEAKLEVDPKSVLSDKIHIKSMVLMAPAIVIEGGLNDNNLKKIQASVESFAGKEKSDASGGKKKLQVDDFLLTGAKVEVRFALLGGQGTALTLPDIHLTNLGAGPDGITPGELSKLVFSAVFDGVLNQVKSLALNGGAKAALDAVKGAGGGAAKNALEKVGGGVGDLFKKK
jgi:hypothetical protein